MPRFVIVIDVEEAQEDVLSTLFDESWEDIQWRQSEKNEAVLERLMSQYLVLQTYEIFPSSESLFVITSSNPNAPIPHRKDVQAKITLLSEKVANGNLINAKYVLRVQKPADGSVPDTLSIMSVFDCSLIAANDRLTGKKLLKFSGPIKFGDEDWTFKLTWRLERPAYRCFEEVTGWWLTNYVPE